MSAWTSPAIWPDCTMIWQVFRCQNSLTFYGPLSPFTFLPVCVKQAEQMDQKINDVLAEQIYQRNPKSLFEEVGIFVKE